MFSIEKVSTRKGVRFAVDLIGKCYPTEKNRPEKVSTQKFDGTVKDISSWGACIVTRFPLKLSEVLKIALPIQSSISNYISSPATLAEVRWTQPIEGGMYVSGFRFLLQHNRLLKLSNCFVLVARQYSCTELVHSVCLAPAAAHLEQFEQPALRAVLPFQYNRLLKNLHLLRYRCSPILTYGFSTLRLVHSSGLAHEAFLATCTSNRFATFKVKTRKYSLTALFSSPDNTHVLHVLYVHSVCLAPAAARPTLRSQMSEVPLGAFGAI